MNRPEKAALRRGRAAGLLILFILVAAVIRGMAVWPPVLRYGMIRFGGQHTGLPDGEVPGAAEMICGYLRGSVPDFQYTFTDAEGRIRLCFTEREAAHMADVRGLIRLDLFAGLGALILLAAVLLAEAVSRRRRTAEQKAGIRDAFRQGVRGGALLFWGVVSVLLIWAAIHFDSFFVTFHRIAFRNTLWVLNPRESLLIRLMPETLFIRLGLWGTGILAVLTAGLLLCFRKRRPTAGKEDPES